MEQDVKKHTQETYGEDVPSQDAIKVKIDLLIFPGLLLETWWKEGFYPVFTVRGGKFFSFMGYSISFAVSTLNQARQKHAMFCVVRRTDYTVQFLHTLRSHQLIYGFTCVSDDA